MNFSTADKGEVDAEVAAINQVQEADDGTPNTTEAMDSSDVKEEPMDIAPVSDTIKILRIDTPKIITTVKILKFGTPQTIAIIVLKIEKFNVTLH